MEADKEGNSYRSILKGTSVLGGMQVFLVLLNLIRGKFVALFLGADGMGIAAIFNSSQNTLQRFSSLGLTLAIVKDVAENKKDADPLGHIIAVANRLVLLTALAGSILSIFLCQWLSRISFGDDSYAWQFVLLGVSIFFATEGAGKMSVLQGLHKVKILSRASVTGGITGLAVGVPLYYFFGTRGIVPAMAVFSLVMYAFYSFNVRHLSSSWKKTCFSWSEHKSRVKHLVGLGLILMSSELIGTLAVYILNIFMREFGSLESVGFYQSANSLTAQSLGLVFTAMSIDYFPRLTNAAHDNTKMISIVNRQAELIALITTPLAILLIISAPLVIRILLTTKFLPIVPLLRIMAFGLTLKALAFPLGYIAFAKDNKRLFFMLEGVMCNILTLILPAAGYYFFGLTGAAWGVVADNGICLIIYYLVNSNLYNYSFSIKALRNYCIAVLFCGAALLGAYVTDFYMSVSIMVLIFISSSAFSILNIKRLV